MQFFHTVQHEDGLNDFYSDYDLDLVSDDTVVVWCEKNKKTENARSSTCHVFWNHASFGFMTLSF